ncbi:MAG: hypothetical protein SFY32_06840 [Bacteroidota bacterium]|nr:hypothetical protein [Bacteroidota bacterium]
MNNEKELKLHLARLRYLNDKLNQNYKPKKIPLKLNESQSFSKTEQDSLSGGFQELDQLLFDYEGSYFDAVSTMKALHKSLSEIHLKVFSMEEEFSMIEKMVEEQKQKKNQNTLLSGNKPMKRLKKVSEY